MTAPDDTGTIADDRNSSATESTLVTCAMSRRYTLSAESSRHVPIARIASRPMTM